MISFDVCMILDFDLILPLRKVALVETQFAFRRVFARLPGSIWVMVVKLEMRRKGMLATNVSNEATFILDSCDMAAKDRVLHE